MIVTKDDLFLPGHEVHIYTEWLDNLEAPTLIKGFVFYKDVETKVFVEFKFCFQLTTILENGVNSTAKKVYLRPITE